MLYYFFSFHRAVTIHNTHNLLVEHNVVHNVKGGAMFIEDGIEHGNVLQYNLVVFCRQSTSLQNEDITPAAFWVTNPNNTIRHNTATGEATIILFSFTVIRFL